MDPEDINSVQQAPSTEFFDHILEGCQIIGFDWCYRYINDAAAAHNRRNKADLLGRKLMDVYPGVQETPLFKTLASSMETRTPAKMVNEFVYPDQSNAWFELMVYPVNDGILVMSQDISARKRAEEMALENRTKLEAALNSMIDAVFISDAQGQFIDFNNAFVTYHRFRNKEECAKTFAEYPDILDVFLPDGTLAPTEMWAVPRALRGEIVENAEYILQRKDTNERWVGSYNFAPIRDKEDAIVGSVVVCRDITESKRAEKELRESEARYRGLFENMLEGFAYCRMEYENNLPVDFTYLEVNQKFEELTALKNVAGKRVSEVIPGVQASNPELFEIYGRVASTGSPEKFETYIPSIGIWFSISVYSYEKGYFIAVFDTITERKQTEEQLRQSERLYRAIGETIDYGVWVCAPDGRNIYASESFLKLVGLTQQQCSDFGWGDVLHPDDTERTLAAWKECVRTGGTWDIEHRYRGVDGQWHAVLARGVPIRDEQGQITCWAGINLDISKQKQAEEALVEQAKMLDLVHVLVRNMDSKIIFWNHGAEELYGWSKDEALGKVTHQLFQTVFPRTLEEVYQDLLKYGVWEGELIHTKRDGSQLFVASHQVLHRDRENRPVAIIEVNNDVTALKHAEEDLQKAHDELEQRVQERTNDLSDLYNNAPCGYHSLDADGLVVRINDTELSWLGYSRAEIVGKVRISDLFTPASLQTFKESFPQFKERGWIKDLYLEMVRKDGSILPVLLSGTAIKDAEGRFLMSRSTMIDYTDRIQAEQAIQKLNDSLEHRSAELETSNKELEAFAYSVSHDLRSPLRAIDGFSRILLEDYDDKLDEEGKRVLNIIRTNTSKMDHLISDLLALSRVSRIELHLSRIDMGTLANSIYFDLASPEIQEKFTFSVSAIPISYGDPTLLRQVWSNLLSNAIKYTLPKEKCSIEVGGYVNEGMNVYYIKDNGVGFNPEYTHKLFGVFQRLHRSDEFEGTGVGLAIVQRIIHRHGGLAWAEGKIDQGATFYFSIPVKENEHEL
jgi:PAS domain S-box/PAS domain S-box/PAS domain S-box